ncbi:MAG: glutamate racemase [Bacteroidales bacterium]|jgi:glutamate racemase|nr:glutamate racemase [Bacteroidales bacterium]
MIGVFDSGYGGLTVLKEMIHRLPEYDYCYLGDNARTPYGSRSFDTVYRYTRQCVRYLFGQGCRLVVIACNTASAKALRNIQQHDLPSIDPKRRVLGVIRPSVEAIGEHTRTGHVGILGTIGTVQSESYLMEIAKFHPHLRVFQEACPMWVPLVECGEHRQGGADYFVRQHIDRLLRQSAEIDTIVLACTHYPLLSEKIRRFTPAHIRIVEQGRIVTESLYNYLQRHPEIEQTLGKSGKRIFQTSDAPELFDRFAAIFFDWHVRSEKVVFQ